MQQIWQLDLWSEDYQLSQNNSQKFVLDGLFSCEEAALEVQMSVCVSVCLIV